MDLLDVYRGSMSLRKLSVLANNLPMDSATIKAQRIDFGDQLTEWTLTDILIGKYIEARTGSQIVPVNDQASGKPAHAGPARQGEIKTVSVAEAMGFATSSAQALGEKVPME